MKPLHVALTHRRKELGLTIADVHAELALRGIKVSQSAVGHWFSGRQGRIDMDHLRALCSILETSISEMAGEDPEFAQNAFESALLRAARAAPQARAEAMLALLAPEGATVEIPPKKDRK